MEFTSSLDHSKLQAGFKFSIERFALAPLVPNVNYICHRLVADSRLMDRGHRLRREQASDEVTNSIG